MNKVYSLGLLVLVLMLVVTVAVACGSKEETTTTVAEVTETTVAEVTETTVAAGAVGMVFKDMGNSVVYITDEVEPGMAFPISTSGDFASEIWATDASGARIADFTTEDGYVDYSSVVDTAVTIHVQGPFGEPFEYTIPQ